MSSVIDRIKEVLVHIDYKYSRDWDFHVFEDGNRPVMQVVYTCREGQTKGRKWFLSPHMTRSEIVRTAFKAILAFEEHETRKGFTFRGKAIFGPHIDVEKLVDLCDDSEALDVRPPLKLAKREEDFARRILPPQPEAV